MSSSCFHRSQTGSCTEVASPVLFSWQLGALNPRQALEMKISPGWRKACHCTQIACIGIQIQSHSLAVKKLLSTKGVRTLHRHCVEYPFSRLRWMQKSPVHSEAAAAARKTAEKSTCFTVSEWAENWRTAPPSLPPSLTPTRTLSLSLSHSLYHLWLESVICLQAYANTLLFPLPPLLSLFLHATALCSTQDISHSRERERRKEREKYTGRAREEGRGRKRQLSACGLLEAILHSTWYENAPKSRQHESRVLFNGTVTLIQAGLK